jgi:hypothetical protein
LRSALLQLLLPELSDELPPDELSLLELVEGVELDDESLLESLPPPNRLVKRVCAASATRRIGDGRGAGAAAFLAAGRFAAGLAAGFAIGFAAALAAGFGAGRLAAGRRAAALAIGRFAAFAAGRLALREAFDDAALREAPARDFDAAFFAGFDALRATPRDAATRDFDAAFLLPPFFAAPLRALAPREAAFLLLFFADFAAGRDFEPLEEDDEERLLRFFAGMTVTPFPSFEWLPLAIGKDSTRMHFIC